MSIVEISIKRPLLVVVVFVVLGLGGIFAYQKLNYELLPKFKIAYVSVSTIYPGASPAEIEQSVTKPLEDAIAGVERVKRINSSSNPDISLVNIEFTYGTNVEQAFQDVQRSVNEVIDKLPAQAKKPVVSKFNVNEVPVIKAAVTADLNNDALSSLLKTQVKPQLARLKGIGKIEFIGLEEKEYLVQISPEKIKHYRISVTQVVKALQESEINMPAGNVASKGYQQGLRLTGKVTDIEALKKTLITTDGSTEIRLSDVAEIVVYAKSKVSTSRLEGKSVISLVVFKQNNANAVEMSEQVQVRLKELEGTFADKKLTFTIAQDGSVFTTASANAVKIDLLLAVALVALVMLVFLHSLRSSMMVLVSLPASLLSTLIFMYFLGYTLNLMTLLAMSLVVGILVDDSIVVLENIYRHLEMGKDKIRATIDGREEIGYTAFAITLVDVVVFVPLALTGGLAGDIVREFAMVIVISTLLSLIVCFTITPMLASRFGRLEHLSNTSWFGRFGLWFEAQFKNLEEAYGKLLLWSLQNKLKVIAVAFVLLAGSLLLPILGYVGSEFAPRIDRGEMAVTVQLPTGSALLQAEAFSRQIENDLRSQFPDITRVMTNHGVTAEAWGAPEERNFQLNLNFKSKEKRTKSIQQLGREIQRSILEHPGTKVKVAMVGLFGTADEAPVQILVSGPSREKVNNVAQQLADEMRAIDGAYDIRMSGVARKYDVQIIPDKDKMAKLGVTAADLGTAVRVAMVGYDDLKIDEETESVPIRIALNPTVRNDMSVLSQIEVHNSAGELIELARVADIQPLSSPAMLERFNKNGSVTIFCGVAGRPVGDVGEDIKTAISKLNDASGVSVDFQGDLASQEDSFGPLGLAFGAGILLMYFIMVALYNSWTDPFVVLFSVPLAVVGALLALGLTGESINIFSIFGMIMMTGLVAKNAILLVDRINQNLQLGHTLPVAIEESGKTRLRPIMMTTIAMVLGMLPIAIAKGNGAEVKNGLAWAIMGGLTSSMFLTLIVVPVVFSMEHRLLARLSSSRVVLAKAAAIVVILLGGIGSTTSLQAQDIVKLSVKDAVAIAIENNASMRIAKLEVAKQQGLQREAFSFRLPQVNGFGTYVHNTQVPVFFFPSLSADPATGELVFGPVRPIRAGSNHFISSGVNASLDLVNFQTRANVKQASLAVEVADKNIKANEQQVAYEVKKTYNDVLLVKSQRLVVLQALERAALTLALQRNMLANGFATPSDTLRVFTDREAQGLDLIQLKYAEENLLNLLRYQLGLRAQTQLMLTDQEFTNELDDRQQDQHFSNRADLDVYQAQIKRAKQSLRAAQASSLPTLSLSGNWQLQGQDDKFNLSTWNFPQSSFIGATINVPLFNGFRREARTQQANAEIQQATWQYQDALSRASLEYQQQTNRYLELRQKLDVQKLLAASAKRSLELQTDRYKNGLAKWLDVKDAELVLTQNQFALAQVQSQLNGVLIELEKINPSKK
ncbi:MAG: efflux RND transporter permease subunit [Flammeovirgaceae bacterium]